MASASSIERQLYQLKQELEQMRHAQKTQRIPRAEMILVKITGNDVPALLVEEGVETTGSGLATPYYIDSYGYLQPHRDAGGVARSIEVRNASPEVAKVGSFYPTLRMPDGKRLLDLTTSNTKTEPTWIDFQLTADMTGSGQTTATVQAIRGDAVIDTVGGEVETVAVGSTVTVYDDNGLWGDLVTGCTGKALYRPHPSNPLVAQFGIHSSTRPINKIVARVSGEMLATSESVTVDTLNRILSQEPHISAPSELLAEPIAVKAANDWNLHAQYGSDVEIERVREGITIGEGESAETVYWRVTRVSLPFPYRILGKLTEDFGAVTSTYTPVEVIKSFGATYDQISVNGHLVDTFSNYFISEHSNFFWKKGDRAVLEYDAQENKYFITRVMGRAEWIKGTVYADFTATDATFELTNLAGIDGPLEELVTQITVANIHGWDGSFGDKVVVQRNLATGAYEARQKDSEKVELIHAMTPTGGVPAKSGNTMGSAACNLYVSDSSGVLTAAGSTITLYNDTSGEVAGSTAVSAIRNSAGLPVIVVEDCRVQT